MLVRTCAYVCVRACACVRVCTRLCVCVCVCVCDVYITILGLMKSMAQGIIILFMAYLVLLMKMGLSGLNKRSYA